MRWAHLPVAGGLYDQDPRFIDDMYFLMGKDEEAQKRRQEREEAKRNQASRGKGGGKGRRR